MWAISIPRSSKAATWAEISKRITFRARKIGDFTKLLILVGDSRLGLASRYTRRGHLNPYLITRVE
jgi:hypothetical protein